jgi:anti-sigma B factor antagonist
MVLPDFRCDTTRSDGRTTITLGGEIDYPVMPDVLAAADVALRARPALLAIDLAGVAFMDSGALSGLLTLRQRAGDAGVGFRLRATSRIVLRILEISGIDGLFEIEAGGPEGHDEPEPNPA